MKKRDFLKCIAVLGIVPTAVIAKRQSSAPVVASTGYGMNDLASLSGQTANISAQAYTVDGIHPQQAMADLRIRVMKFSVFDSEKKLVTTGFLKPGEISEVIPLRVAKGERFYAESVVVMG